MSSNTEETEPLLARTATKHPTFEVDDPKDPRNWSRFRKWFMIAIILPIDLSVSWGASGFSPVSSDFAKDIGVSPQIATLGLSLYVLGLAVGPMTLAPLSETFGRVPIYILSYATFLILLLATTYTDHLAPFLVLRLFSGYFASTTISNFGGTIADIFHHHETGPAMSWFLWAATGGSPTGFVLFSFIGHDRSWRDTLRIMFYICFAFWIAMSTSLLLLGETRHNVILLRRAKTDGVEVSEHDDTARDVQPRSPVKLIRTALLRPFRFLGTEAIVQFAALYNGFLYGLSFLFNGAFHIIFGPKGYGFNTSQIGLCFLGIVFGICAGLFTNIFQERYYQRVTQNGHREAPEARIHLSKLAAVVLPLSLLAFGLLAEPSISPHYAIAASAFWGWSFYTLILMTLIYTEDAYKTYSASALAGIGLIRNVGGAGIPIIGRSLFLNLGTRNASFVLTAIAVCLAPIPFVLDSKGSSLRRRSPWAAAHAELDDDAE